MAKLASARRASRSPAAASPDRGRRTHTPKPTAFGAQKAGGRTRSRRQSRSLKRYGVALIIIGLVFTCAAIPWPGGAEVEADLWDSSSLVVLAWAALLLGGLLTWQG